MAPPPPCYGAKRNALYARAKLVMDVLSFPDGSVTNLRAVVCVSNLIPMLSERRDGITDFTWDFVPTAEYGGLVDAAVALVHRTPEARRASAEQALEAFKKMPMVLP